MKMSAHVNRDSEEYWQLLQAFLSQHADALNRLYEVAKSSHWDLAMSPQLRNAITEVIRISDAYGASLQQLEAQEKGSERGPMLRSDSD